MDTVLMSFELYTGGFIAHVAFEDSDIKTRAQGFLSSITNSFEAVLRRNVEVKLSLLEDSLEHEPINEIPVNQENKSTCSNVSTSMEDSKSDIPLQKTESVILEQISKNASLQASDKGTPQSMSNLRPERNQVLPQDELNDEMTKLNMNDEVAPQKDQVVQNADHCPISPSLLHNTTFGNSVRKDNK